MHDYYMNKLQTLLVSQLEVLAPIRMLSLCFQYELKQSNEKPTYSLLDCWEVIRS